jgi:hypothetical protein
MTKTVVPFWWKMSCPKRGYASIVWWNCQRLTDSCQNFILSCLMRSLNIDVSKSVDKLIQGAPGINACVRAFLGIILAWKVF